MIYNITRIMIWYMINMVYYMIYDMYDWFDTWYHNIWYQWYNMISDIIYATNGVHSLAFEQIVQKK